MIESTNNNSMRRRHGCLSCPRLLALLALAFSIGILRAQPLTAVVEPAFTNAAPGSSVTLCLNVTGTPPFTFQWQKNGILLPGETNLCLTLTNLAAADGGSYRAAARQADVALWSQEALLTVALPTQPGGDAFAGSTEIFALSNDVRGDSAGATREPGEPRHAGLRGSNSVWYTWTAPVAGIATFDTQGSTYDTVLAVYTGGGLENLVEVAGDDDGGGFHTSRVQFNAEEGVTYRVAIDSLAAEEGSYNCRWNLEFTDERVPVITTRPQAVTVPWGGTALFTAAVDEAASGPDLRFQWFRRGAPLPGANALTLSIPYVNASHLGDYTFAVTNAHGRFAVSPPAALEIGPDPTVQSRDKVGLLSGEASGAGTGSGGGRVVSLTGSFGGTFSLAAGTIINQQFFNAGTSDRCEPAHCNVPGGASRWFQLVAETNGICTVDTRGSDADTVLAVYLQNFQICTRLFDPLVGCNNDAGGTCAQLLQGEEFIERSSRYSFFAPAGSIYRVVVDTVSGVIGTNTHFNVRFTADPPAADVTPVILGETPITRLVLPGQNVALRVAPEFHAPENVYEWRVDRRIIAGAAGPNLWLPRLNFSEAGQYEVLIDTGDDPIALPGVSLSVIQPCAEEEDGFAANDAGRMVHLWGAASELLQLEAATNLTGDTAWEPAATVDASRKPALWHSRLSRRQFYRVAPLPP